MAKMGVFKVDDHNPEQAFRDVCARWLKEEKLSAILVPAVSPLGVVAPALVTTPEAVKRIAPLCPAMSVNGANIVMEIAQNPAAPETRVGLMLRPCELRAVVELVKLKQIALDNLILIGIDCPGTYKVSVYNQLSQSDPEFNNRFVKSQGGYLNDERLRSACQMCEFPTPLVADLAIGFLGMNPAKEIFFEAVTAKGETLLDGFALDSVGEVPAARREYLAAFRRGREEKAAQFIAQFEQVALGPENLLRYFANCLNCHNCMHVCPVCYCRECFFESEALKREMDETVRLARRKGISRMPAGTMLFHLTRMNHMMTSCVQCGICEESCPVQIGLSVLFKKVSRAAQAEFAYLSGRSLEEPLPLTTFREDEFRTVGEG